MMSTTERVGPCRVAIAGFGTVGQAVARILSGDIHPSLQLTHICNRQVHRKKVDWVAPEVVWTDTFDDVLDGSVDVVVELIGGRSPARDWIEQALAAGVAVVTANKQVIAHEGVSLGQAARQANRPLLFEAAVAGGVPIVRSLREGIAGDRLYRIQGVLNGTCNYILTRMEQEGLSFEECLKDAQRLGYAEANPSFDVDGHDTAQKLAILASLAFGTKVAESAVYVEGISSITPEDLKAASELGYRVKLLGVAVRTAKGIEQRVHPTMVPKSSSIAQVMGVTNAVAIDGEGIPPITLVGPGAGGDATASAVVADIADVARGIRAKPFGRPVERLRDTTKAPMERHEGGYYIRLMARDLAGTAATIATRLAEQKISLESIVQRHPDGVDVNGAAKKPSPVPVILITYATSEDAVHRALAAVQRDKVISGRPQVIRIEKN